MRPSVVDSMGALVEVDGVGIGWSVGKVSVNGGMGIRTGVGVVRAGPAGSSAEAVSVGWGAGKENSARDTRRMVGDSGAAGRAAVPCPATGASAAI